jgi:hypothetical protein
MQAEIGEAGKLECSWEDRTKEVPMGDSRGFHMALPEKRLQSMLVPILSDVWLE